MHMEQIYAYWVFFPCLLSGPPLTVQICACKILKTLLSGLHMSHCLEREGKLLHPSGGLWPALFTSFGFMTPLANRHSALSSSQWSHKLD